MECQYRDGWREEKEMTDIVCSVESEEGVGREHLAAGGKGMADLEERVYREALVQFGSQASKSLVVEENAALDLLCDLIDGTWVTKAERCSSVVEGSVCIEEGVDDGVCSRGWRCDNEGGCGDGLALHHWDFF